MQKKKFYQKKGLYVVLTILFSLIILADVALVVLVPTPGGRGGNRGEISGEMPEMPEGGFEGEMPEMPEGGFEGEMPEMPEGGFEGEMKGMPGMGFWQVIRANWLIILIISAIFDGVSIFMLIWTIREKKVIAEEVVTEE